LTPQLPAFALRDPAGYAAFMQEMDARYAAGMGTTLGPLVVDVFERLGFFRVFSSPAFIALLVLLVVSIVVCTLDRTPRLWRGVSRINVRQPAPFFDPRLPQRAAFASGAVSADDLAAALRSRRFRVRRAASEGPGAAVAWVYGDRHQYSKMATLLTHLGLILFLVGGAVTAAFGFETVLFVGEGQTAPVRPVGTPHNLLVKNIAFEAPMRPDGTAEDFRTDLAVYRDGEQVARKTIRVNDPLQLDGYVFHQNTFGPTADIEIRDADGALLWTGPVLLAGEIVDLPEGALTIPGSPVNLRLVLQRDSTGTPLLGVVGLAPTATAGESEILFLLRLGLGATTDPADSAGYAITWLRAGEFTGMVVKRDPGAPIIWLAFAALMAGLLITFYLPRRRVWARVTPDGTGVAMVADRYVDVDREFGRLVEDLGARTGHRPARLASQPGPSG
jgi:cytochrome c biogenesis protein